MSLDPCWIPTSPLSKLNVISAKAEQSKNPVITLTFQLLPQIKHLSYPAPHHQAHLSHPPPAFPLYLLIPAPPPAIHSHILLLSFGSNLFSRLSTICFSRFLTDPMAPNPDVAALESSFASKLRIPGAIVASSEVSDAVWKDMMEQNKLALAIKVLGKSIMSIRKTVEIFTGVLWARAEGVALSFEGEDLDGSRFFLAKFGVEADIANIVSRSPWTVGGHLAILEAYDSLKRVSEHDFQTSQIWLQIHGLPPFAAKNREIILSLAGKAGSPIEKSLIFLQEFSKIKVTINPQAQLTSGAFLKRPKQSDIPVLFRYEKTGLICFRCAHLGHKEKSCKHQSFLEGSPMAFSFLEGFPAVDSPSMNRRTTSSGKTLVVGENIGSQGKISPLNPKNLLQDLDESLLGSGSRISKVDKEHGILSLPSTVNKEQEKAEGTQEKQSLEPLNPRISLASPAPPKLPPVEHLIHESEGGSPTGYNKGVDFFGQTYIFKAAENISLKVTPYLIKKTKKAKGPGPMWQRVPIGIPTMRKGNLSLLPDEDPTAALSKNIGTSSQELSENSVEPNQSLNKNKLLEWNGNFSNFTEQDEESESEEESVNHVGTKRYIRSPADPEAASR